MLFKFKSQVTSDLIMLEADARRLLHIMLGHDPDKGIILVKDLPAAIAKLESAVAQDEATTLPMATSLRRNPRLVVPTAPGAVAVGPNEFANGADLIDRINIAADQHFDEHKSTSSSNADNGLVTAIPVEEDSAAFISQEAQPFDHSMEELRLLYRKRAQRRTLYCRIMAAITITVPIIVVGVYFGLKGGEQESQSPTFSPTPFPSSAPSIF